MKKATDEEIASAYRRTKSVWKAAKELGMGGQTVHQRLIRMGVDTTMRGAWTDQDVRTMLNYYWTTPEDEFDLNFLAKELGRLKSNVCRKARSYGITDMRRKPAYEERVKRSDRSRIETQKRVTKFGTSMRFKGGTRDDLGFHVRSAWEANYARYLKFLIKCGNIRGFEYEPKVFYFEGVKRNPISYLPDFKVFKNDGTHEWHEVKGYMDSRSKSKLKRMAKFYPEEKVIVIGKKEYAEISRYSQLIPNWE